MINTKKSFKDFISKLDDEKWTEWKKRSKKKKYGLKKGDGGLPENGPDGADNAMVSENMIARVFSSKIMSNIVPEDEENFQQDPENKPDESEMEMNDINNDEINSSDSIDDSETQDPDRQGVIRVVKGAHLVYKRQNEKGSYDELWVFKNDNAVKNDIDLKNDILSGTDIQPNKLKSEDGEQSYELWTAGNVQFLFITGMPQ